MRPSFPYRKKDSQNTQSTSFYQDKPNNKVLSAQKIPTHKLSHFLYAHGYAETRPKSTTSILAPTDRPKPKEMTKIVTDDPFMQAKLKFLYDEAAKHSIPKKTGILYDELNGESIEPDSTTTLKKEQEKENRERVSSIRNILCQRNKQ